MASRQGIRAGLLDAGFAVAERLRRLGLGGLTWRARRALGRLGADRHAIELDGLTIAGSLTGHGPYLRALSTFGGHPLQTRLLADAIEPGASVVDCGAHIGLQTMLAARAAGSAGRVIAIEPEPENLAFLRQNIAANGLAERVEVVGKAVTDSAGRTLFHAGGSRDQAGVVADRLAPGTVEVEATTLDDVLDGRRFDAAKIDVEGAEALVLAGASESLARSPGATLLIECHPARLRDLGTDPLTFVAGLRELGRLELLDEDAGTLAPASDGAIAAAVEEHFAAFGVRLLLT